MSDTTFQVPPPAPGPMVDPKTGTVNRSWWWFFFNLWKAAGGGALITKLGTVTVGTWNATRIAVGFGGTGADLSATGGSHQVLRQSSAGAAITVSQLAAGDISGLAAIASSGSASDLITGTVPPARLPAPTATTLGGVESLAAVSHNFLTSIATSGAPTQAQPAATDLSDYAAGSWTPTDASGASLSFTVTDAVYRKIGALAVVSAVIVFPTTASGLAATIGGLPVARFTGTNAITVGIVEVNGGAGLSARIASAASQFTMNTLASDASVLNSALSGKTILFTLIYPTA